jgi:hypothetical protein
MQWLMLVMPATQEMEIGKREISKTAFQQKARHR